MLVWHAIFAFCLSTHFWYQMWYCFLVVRLLFILNVLFSVAGVLQSLFALVSYDVTFDVNANVLGSFNVSTVVKCASLCQQMPPCRAFVLNVVNNGMRKCVLSDDVINTVSGVGSNLWDRQ